MVWQAGGHHVSVHVYQSWLTLWHLYDLTDSGVVVVVIVWKLNLQLPLQSVPITTKVVSLNPVHGDVYAIQQYVLK
jgi:hypothetical protein